MRRAVRAKSIGQIMQVEGYRLPLFIAGQIDDGLAAPLVFFHKTVPDAACGV